MKPEDKQLMDAEAIVEAVVHDEPARAQELSKKYAQRYWNPQPVKTTNRPKVISVPGYDTFRGKR